MARPIQQLILLLVASSPLAAQQWELQSPSVGPAAQWFLSLAFDEANNDIVLFGGYSLTWHGDTWLWRNGNWRQAMPATVPPARYSHAMAYDYGRGRVVMFGGADQNNAELADTWEWDGTDWTLMQPATAPTPRRQMRMAFDPVRGTVILFGGGVGPSGYIVMGDTWEWDGVGWTQLSPRTSPPARWSYALSTDWGRGEILLFGGSPGRGSSPLGDTWTWDGTDWTQHSPNLSPPARRRVQGAFNSVRNRVLIAGGDVLVDTWEWDGARWWATADLPRTGAANGMAGGFLRAPTLLYGGTWNDTTILYRPDNAGVTYTGRGCGTAPEIRATALAAPGQWFAGEVRGCPGNLALVAFNLSGPTGRPFDLGPFGAPGCTAEVEPSGALVQTVVPVAGTASWSLFVPNIPVVVGLDLYVQGFPVAPGANPAGLLATDLCVASIF